MQEKNNKISPIKKRILQFIDYKGITKANFCELTGISYPNLNSKSLESELGGTQITLIASVFNEISLDWLILGKGEMLRSASTDNSIPESDIIKAYKAIIETQKKTITSLERQIDLLEDRLNDENRGGGEAATMAG